MMDKVKCMFCGAISLVHYEQDDCPNCEKLGFLLDIEQNV